MLTISNMARGKWGRWNRRVRDASNMRGKPHIHINIQATGTVFRFTIPNHGIKLRKIINIIFQYYAIKLFKFKV